MKRRKVIIIGLVLCPLQRHQYELKQPEGLYIPFGNSDNEFGETPL